MREPVVHRLKTWPIPFDAVQRSEKPFEVRRDDRMFQRGDVVVLMRWDPENCGGSYTGQRSRHQIGWMLHGPAFGIEAGFVVFALEPLALANAPVAGEVER